MTTGRSSVRCWPRPRWRRSNSSAAHSPQLKGKGCAAILKTLMGQTPSSARANPMTAGIASLRFEGNRGFALFHGAGDVNFFVPMIKEDGKWKVGAIAPTEIP